MKMSRVNPELKALGNILVTLCKKNKFSKINCYSKF